MESCIIAGSKIALHTFDAFLIQFLLMRQGPLMSRTNEFKRNGNLGNLTFAMEANFQGQGVVH